MPGFTCSAKTDSPEKRTGENLQQQKITAEVRRILSDAELREHKLLAARGEVIPKSQVEIELSERASNLKTYFNSVARSSAGRIIKIVKGDPQKAQESSPSCWGSNKKAFDNYSRPIQGLEDEED